MIYQLNRNDVNTLMDKPSKKFKFKNNAKIATRNFSTFYINPFPMEMYVCMYVNP